MCNKTGFGRGICAIFHTFFVAPWHPDHKYTMYLYVKISCETTTCLCINIIGISMVRRCSSVVERSTWLLLELHGSIPAGRMDHMVHFSIFSKIFFEGRCLFKLFDGFRLLDLVRNSNVISRYARKPMSSAMQ